MLGQRAAARHRQSEDVRPHREHPVEGAVDDARGIADDVIHRQQVLVIQRLLAQPAAIHGHDFAQRNRLAGGGAHGQLQQRLKVPLCRSGKLQADGRRILRRVVQIADILASESRPQRRDDVVLANAEQRRLRPIHIDHPARRVGDRALVGIDHAGLLAECGLDLLRDLDAPRVVRTVDLGDDRRQHRRARRNLHDLDLRAIRVANPLEFRADARRDDVALVVPVRLVDQIDLKVADVASAAQVILAHEAVEIDRCRRSGEGLVVGDLGNLRQVGAHFAQRRRRAFERSSGRHVDDDLELRLVVERQHLHHDQLERRQCERDRDQRRDAKPKPKSIAPARGVVQEWREDAFESRSQPRCLGAGCVTGHALCRAGSARAMA